MLRGGLAVLLTLAACSPSTPGGGGDAVPVAPACGTYSGGTPGTRTYLLAYYPPGGYPILFSQRADEPSTGTPFETWMWKCGWKHAAGPDPQVWGYAMAYYPALHQTILVGAKTMGWDGSSWIDLQVKPPLNLGTTSMVFDAARNVLLLVDSYPSGVNTWTFDGRSWKNLSTTGPANEAAAAVAYDPRSRAVLLFGGFASGYGGAQQVTWRWDGSSWTLLDPDTSPPGGPAVMAYDEATRQMILVTWDPTTAAPATWEWTGVTWRQLEIAGPQFNLAAEIVYDAARQDLFYFVDGEVWAYTGTWAQLLATG